jgi:hypothetical protein
MKKKLIGGLLVASLITVPVVSKASFLSSIVDGMTSVANNVVDSSTEVSQDMLDLFGALADDIGEMADRILVMADKIGEMADRIVETERMMADVAIQVGQINENTNACSYSIESDPGIRTVLITADIYQGTLWENEAPRFDMSESTASYLVYVSSTMAMNSNTVSIMVDNQTEFSSNWSNFESLAQDNKIYIAVKTIENNIASPLSNVLEYQTSY